MGGWVDFQEWVMDGFINPKDMYNNDVGQGGVRVYEAMK